MTDKIVTTRHRGDRTEIELHGFRDTSTTGLDGVELIIDQTPEHGRRKFFTIPLMMEQVRELHTALGEYLIDEDRA